MDMKLVIFDMDGTLFRTETVDIEAFNKALSANGYEKWSDRDILGLIGLTLDEICEKLTGSNDFNKLRKLRQDIIRFEEDEIFTSGKLYTGVEMFLERLKNEGYTLCICSNGNKEYVTAIAQKFNFASYFSEVWYEKKGFTKEQAVSAIKSRFNADKFIMVGDRLCDIDAARLNGGISVGVTYGFGKDEVMEADYVAHSINEVEEIIRKILA